MMNPLFLRMKWTAITKETFAKGFLLELLEAPVVELRHNSHEGTKERRSEKTDSENVERTGKEIT